MAADVTHRRVFLVVKAMEALISDMPSKRLVGKPKASLNILHLRLGEDGFTLELLIDRQERKCARDCSAAIVLDVRVVLRGRRFCTGTDLAQYDLAEGRPHDLAPKRPSRTLNVGYRRRRFVAGIGLAGRARVQK